MYSPIIPMVGFKIAESEKLSENLSLFMYIHYVHIAQNVLEY